MHKKNMIIYLLMIEIIIGIKNIKMNCKQNYNFV